MLESKFKRELRHELEYMFPGCVLINLDPLDIQGIPDLLILYKEQWAALECKRDSSASRQPNQEYYVDLLDNMSYSVFVHPQNREEVLYELQQLFASRRNSRVLKRK